MAIENAQPTEITPDPRSVSETVNGDGPTQPSAGSTPPEPSEAEPPTLTVSDEGDGDATHETDGAASISDLVKRLSEQTSRLARQEIDLAKAELTLKGKRAGIGVGLFGGAALFGLYAVGALCAAAIILIGRAVTPWLAAAIVAAGLGLLAGIVALIGLRKVKQAVPPMPEQTAESVKQDVEMAKSRAQAGRA